MNILPSRTWVKRALANYGMAIVLVLLCVYYSWATLQRQQPSGKEAATAVLSEVTSRAQPGARILIVARTVGRDQAFAEELTRLLVEKGYISIQAIEGEPQSAREALTKLEKAPALIATTEEAAQWLEPMLLRMPEMARTPVVVPRSYFWPTFLQLDNLLNVANQIAVIALIAVGMTMVIITGGIDLSVGSLVALSAVLTGMLIRDYGGGAAAGAGSMLLCALGGILACGLMGGVSGVLVTRFALPPFIATLGIMRVAYGLAFEFSKGLSIYEIPASSVWLGRGADLLSIPNAVVLMAVVYWVAHVLMSHTTFGRYVYAVGGNLEAARLSGVRVKRMLLTVYIVSGLMAGLGGVIVTSQLKSSSPTYGLGYELLVIAAVVVGGTSLSGGSGKILGTLIGAFIIAVVQNGMNLTGVSTYRQYVVQGVIILASVLLDQLRRRNWRLTSSL
jgi:ribose transport system permease protein